MSQVFSADARVNPNGLPLPVNTNVEIVRTVALQVPYETAKAKILGVAGIHPGADNTSITLTLVRNPEAEGIVVGSAGYAFTAGSVGNASVVVAGIDFIDPAQDVVYSLVAICNGVADDGDGNDAPYIEAMLLSG